MDQAERLNIERNLDQERKVRKESDVLEIQGLHRHNQQAGPIRKID